MCDVFFGVPTPQEQVEQAEISYDTVMQVDGEDYLYIAQRVS